MQKLLITHCVRAHVALTAFPTSHSLQWVVSLSGMLLNLCEGLRKAIPSICTIMKHHIVPTLLLMWGWAICTSQNKKIYTRRPTFSVAFLLWKYALLLALPKQLYSGLQEKFSTLYLIKNNTHKQQQKNIKAANTQCINHEREGFTSWLWELLCQSCSRCHCWLHLLALQRLPKRK